MKTALDSVHLLSWDHDGQGRLVVSVVTTMVTKVTISCPDLVWLSRFLRHSASHGGSTEIANPPTNMGLTHVSLTPKEVYTLTLMHTNQRQMHHRFGRLLKYLALMMGGFFSVSSQK